MKQLLSNLLIFSYLFFSSLSFTSPAVPPDEATSSPLCQNEMNKFQENVITLYLIMRVACYVDWNSRFNPNPFSDLITAQAAIRPVDGAVNTIENFEIEEDQEDEVTILMEIYTAWKAWKATQTLDLQTDNGRHPSKADFEILLKKFYELQNIARKIVQNHGRKNLTRNEVDLYMTHILRDVDVTLVVPEVQLLWYSLLDGIENHTFDVILKRVSTIWPHLLEFIQRIPENQLIEGVDFARRAITTNTFVTADHFIRDIRALRMAHRFERTPTRLDQHLQYDGLLRYFTTYYPIAVNTRRSSELQRLSLDVRNLIASFLFQVTDFYSLNRLSNFIFGKRSSVEHNGHPLFLMPELDEVPNEENQTSSDNQNPKIQ